MLRHVATTLEIVNGAALDTLTQGAGDQPQFGEGLADSFEIGFG